MNEQPIQLMVVDRPNHPQNRVRLFTLITWVLLLLLALSSFVCLILVFLDKQSDQNQFLADSAATAAQSKANAGSIAALTTEVETLQAQLENARTLLASTNTEDRLSNECVDFASASLVGNLADLVVTLATTPPGSAEREAAAADVIAKLEAAKDYVLQVVEERPTDCPPYPLSPGAEPG